MDHIFISRSTSPMGYIRLIFLSLLVTITPSYIHAYKILCIFPSESESHFAFQKSIVTTLAKRGHQLDVISHYPPETPIENYNHLLTWKTTESDNVTTRINTKVTSEGFFSKKLKTFNRNICNLMRRKGMKDFIQNLDKHGPYDAIITEVFTVTCYLAFGYHLDVPIIASIPMVQGPQHEFAVRNPPSLSYVPHLFYDDIQHFSHLRFWQRFRNTLSYYSTIYWHYTSIKEEDRIVRKTFGFGMPSLWKIQSNVALTLVNTHFSITGVKPLLPVFVEVAGIHISEDKTVMDQELRQWLDESTDGVVYFSLGTTAPLESTPDRTIRIILTSLAEIAPVRVLIQLKSPHLIKEQIPFNVKILSNVPQIPVLCHKNTQLMISHGSSMDLTETVYCGVPMIAIPVFPDQFWNVYRARPKGFVIPLPADQITEKSFRSALKSALLDPKYKMSAERASRQFRDRPLNVSETTGYWVEYAIRRGPKSLISPGTNLYLWQFELWDVYLFFIATIIAIVYICYKILKKIISVQLKAAYDWKKEQ